MIFDEPRVRSAIGRVAPRTVYVALSGAHLYGFPSPDSDLDLRGIHVLPLATVLGIDEYPTSYEGTSVDGLEPLLDIVSHDIAKVARLFLKYNGNILEMIYAPQSIGNVELRQRLLDFADASLSRAHVRHFRHFSLSEVEWLRKARKPTAKKWLYAFRTALVGWNLLTYGQVESNLAVLVEHYGHEGLRVLLNEVLAIKLGAEGGVVPSSLHQRLTMEIALVHGALDRHYHSCGGSLPFMIPDTVEAAVRAWVVHERKRWEDGAPMLP